MDERTGQHADPPDGRRGDGERGGPPDPTRRLLKVFGVKVTDYESKTDALLARWPDASPADREAIAREAAELSADLAHRLRDLQTHVLERLERVLTAIGTR